MGSKTNSLLSTCDRWLYIALKWIEDRLALAILVSLSFYATHSFSVLTILYLWFCGIAGYKGFEAWIADKMNQGKPAYTMEDVYLIWFAGSIGFLLLRQALP